MSKLRCVVLSVALLTTAATAWSMDKNKEFRTLGVGAQSCSDYLTARNSKDPDTWAPYGIWMTGFVTANNFGQRDTYDLLGNTTPEQAMAVLDSYCSDNPRHPYVYAVMQLVSKTLAPQRIEQKPESAPAPIPIPSPDLPPR